MGTREELLARQRDAQAREAELYHLVVDGPVPEDGGYRVKDHIAHVAAWRRRAARVLQGAGEAVTDVDAWNEGVYQRTRDVRAAEVVRDASESWDELIASVESLSEDQLHGAHPFNPDLELWVVVFANGDKHFEEHAGYIASLQRA